MACASGCASFTEFFLVQDSQMWALGAAAAIGVIYYLDLAPESPKKRKRKPRARKAKRSAASSPPSAPVKQPSAPPKPPAEPAPEPVVPEAVPPVPELPAQETTPSDSGSSQLP